MSGKADPPRTLQAVPCSANIQKYSRGSGSGGGGGVWNYSLTSKQLAHYSLPLKVLLIFFKNPLFFKMLIDFRQFLYDLVEKTLFKAVFFLFVFLF